jgi:hypothetical protein
MRSGRRRAHPARVSDPDPEAAVSDIIRTEAPQTIAQIEMRWRIPVAALLVICPVLWVLEEALQSHDEAELTVGIASMPFAAAYVVTVVVLTRRCTRWAVPAGVVLGLGLIGLAMVHGLEFAELIQVQSAAEQAEWDRALDVAANVPAVLTITMFFGGGLLGTILEAVAFWRSPWVPKGVPLLVTACAVLDLIVDWHLAGLTIGAVAAIWLAVVVVRTGAPVPVRERILVTP